MLIINVDGTESYDSVNNEFIQTSPPKLVRLEHSLLSLSKWEQIMEKPFIPPSNGMDDDRTDEDYKKYLECMIVGHVSDETLDSLWNNHFDEVRTYIEAPSTATVIRRNRKNKKINTQRITSELIYYWMIHFNIPAEFEKWHLNRLLILIDICNIYNDPKRNKMSMIEATKTRDQLNAERQKGGVG